MDSNSIFQISFKCLKKNKDKFNIYLLIILFNFINLIPILLGYNSNK